MCGLYKRSVIASLKEGQRSLEDQRASEAQKYVPSTKEINKERERERERERESEHGHYLVQQH